MSPIPTILCGFQSQTTALGMNLGYVTSLWAIAYQFRSQDVIVLIRSHLDYTVLSIPVFLFQCLQNVPLSMTRIMTYLKGLSWTWVFSLEKSKKRQARAIILKLTWNRLYLSHFRSKRSFKKRYFSFLTTRAI